MPRKPAQAPRPAPLDAEPRKTRQAPARVAVPFRFAAWLQGDLGAQVARRLEESPTLAHVAGLRVTRLPRVALVEGETGPGDLLDSVAFAVRELESWLAATYPVFMHEVGPAWTGTLQVIYTEG